MSTNAETVVRLRSGMANDDTSIERIMIVLVLVELKDN